jgi:DNA modification methylase
MSRPDIFRFEYIWRKNTGTGIATAKFQPLRYHESVLVFYKGRPTFNKIMQPRHSAASERRIMAGPIQGGGTKTSKHISGLKTVRVQYNPKEKNPGSILEIDTVPNAKGKLHPTQKPVALFEYLIQTYTNSGDLVLDNVAGSGTTAIAATNLGRRWVCIEKDETYFSKAITRSELGPLGQTETA